MFLCLAVSACGPRTLPPQSPLDTAANHYQRGLAGLAAADLATAQREFERAQALDPGFAGAFVGQALVAMEQGDFWRARQDVARAVRADADFVDGYIALGRIATAEGVERQYPAREWLGEALRAYRKALDKGPGSLAVHYYQGQTYFAALDLAQARASFTRVVAANQGPWVAPSMAQIEKIQMIERGAPGSEIGLKIALVPRLSRGELAVLLLEELKLGEVVKQRWTPTSIPGFHPPQAGPAGEPAHQPIDIGTSWARPWIEEVLRLGVPGLELYPDRTFQPEQPVRRADYAVVNQAILTLITGDAALATRYLGEPSRFADVRSDFYAYNAIALNAERGIMPADPITGLFRPDDPISGAEALLIIRQLQNAVRLEF